MFRRALVTTLLCGASAAGAFLLGFAIADQGFFPSALLLETKKFVHERMQPESERGKTSAGRLETTLLPLRMQRIKVSVGDSGAGGALTSVGQEVILLTRPGELFVLEGTTARKMGIDVPNNHLREYRAAAETKFSSLTHDFRKFRYNDVLFLANGDEAMLVISYTEWRPRHECYCTTVARVLLPPNTQTLVNLTVARDQWEIVYRTKPCLPLKSRQLALEGNIAGGRMTAAGAGKIFLGTGDYRFDGIWGSTALAQRADNDYGKILEIDLNTGKSIVVSRGHRNVQGIATDAIGRLWATEHGPRGGDELNWIRPGYDYGWPQATLGTRYNKLPWPGGGQYGRHDQFQAPVFAWLPSIGVSNATFISEFDPSWDGDLLLAALKAKSLYRLRMAGESVQFVEQIEIGERIRYVLQHNDGRLVLWTDAHNLIVLTKDDSTPADEFIKKTVAEMSIDQAAKQKLLDAIASCAECHSFEGYSNLGAPNLGDVFGRAIGATAYDAYSPALASKRGVWGESTLTAFIHDSERFAPGTTMPPTNLSVETTTNLVRVLEVLALSDRESNVLSSGPSN